MVAPGTAAPWASMTLPLIVAVETSAWGKTDASAAQHSAAPSAARRTMGFMIFFSSRGRVTTWGTASASKDRSGAREIQGGAVIAGILAGNGACIREVTAM